MSTAPRGIYRKGEKRVAPTEQVDTRYGIPKMAPKSAKLRAFFAEYIKDYNGEAAGIRAGYAKTTANRGKLHKELKRYGDYLAWLQAHAAQATIKLIVVDQEMVLQEIARIGMANEFDYLVMEPRDGMAPRVRRKRLDELTREQMTAIKVTRAHDGHLRYELRDKEGKLTELAKHVGLLNEKIILERRHLHLHQHFDFSKVPLDQLEAIEGQYEKVFEQAGSRALEAK